MTLDAANRPPEDRSMESRMSKVEDDLVAIKIELAVMKAQLANCATKADIAELKAEIKAAENRMVLWVVSVFILAQVLPPLMHKLGL